MEKIELVARAICVAAGDDPDLLVMPAQPALLARKSGVAYLPTGYSQPCWMWYRPEAEAAIKAMEPKPE